MESKIRATVFGTVALVVLTANAQTTGHGGHGTTTRAAAPASGEDPLTEGTIKKIDKATGRLTISHGPLANLSMPGMTMVFHVKDAAMLEGVAAGDRIRFRADKLDGAFTVVRMEPAR